MAAQRRFASSAPSLEQVLTSRVPRHVQRILDAALSSGSGGGAAVTREDAAVLLSQRSPGAITAITSAADYMRQNRIGESVSYAVNRNIQFTNVCVKRCGFCAFSRTLAPKKQRTSGTSGTSPRVSSSSSSSSGGANSVQDEGYFMPMEEVARRTQEAVSLGATEVCAQAGLPPGMEPGLYEEVAEVIKRAAPGIHLHAFSPEEVLYGAKVSRRSVKETLLSLQAAGVDSLPGTSAEILVDEVRKRLAAARLSSEEWRSVIETAHEIGLPTTSTMMYGHVETPADMAVHLDILREVQRKALARGGPGRITEFVPLSFVSSEAPMYRLGLLPNCRPGPTGVEVLLVHAVSRIVLDGLIDNIQASWVKEGPRMAQVLLQAGANDLGGTLMNESISTAAGSQHGQRLSPKELRSIARGIERPALQRTTTYEVLREFPLELDDQDLDAPAWQRQDGDEQFGSYAALTSASHWRYRSELEARRSRLRQSAAATPFTASPKASSSSSSSSSSAISSSRASAGRPFSSSSSSTASTAFAASTSSLRTAASAHRGRSFGTPRGLATQAAPLVVTYSPSYTIVPTFECFNSCSYCNFRASRGESHAVWRQREEVQRQLEGLRSRGDVFEILVLSGEVHPKSKRRRAWLELALDICRMAKEMGFEPHTNIGPVSREEMLELSLENASMGLMLEQSSQRLYLGQPHADASGNATNNSSSSTTTTTTTATTTTTTAAGPYGRSGRKAPSKNPELRRRQLEQAGELKIPFTTGVLLGIGESHEELVSTLDDISESHRRYGHIQECIMQPYRPGSRDEWAPRRTFDLSSLPEVVELARARLPSDIAIQVPPNLVFEEPEVLCRCLEAGARDLGGISPRDEVNPDYSFPTVDELRETLSSWGFDLRVRGAVHDRLSHWAYGGTSGLPSPHFSRRASSSIASAPDTAPAPKPAFFSVASQLTAATA